MDIVERLRLDRPCISDVDCCGDICIEAADEIERLEQEIERLREAIQAISDGIYIAKHYADDALKEKE